MSLRPCEKHAVKIKVEKKSKLLNKHSSGKFECTLALSLSLSILPSAQSKLWTNPWGIVYFLRQAPSRLHRCPPIKYTRIITWKAYRAFDATRNHIHRASHLPSTDTCVMSASLPNMYTAGDTLEPSLGRDRATCRFSWRLAGRVD